MDESPSQGLSPKPIGWHWWFVVQLAEPMMFLISVSSTGVLCIMGSVLELGVQLNKKLIKAKTGNYNDTGLDFHRLSLIIISLLYNAII